MSIFSWEDAFVFDNRTRRYRYDLIRYAIEKYGVNSLDRVGFSIFSCTTGLYYIHHNAIIDVIFEYKPDLLKICKGYISLRAFMISRKYYVLAKFLEQDTEYRYIRCTFRLMNCFGKFEDHPNFMSYLQVYEKFYQEPNELSTFTRMFKNHFCKGITFFELMKFRLIK